ncbi:MAG: M23 family metallopeptidase [Gemmatimonadaceae bacterium]|nr:M23 family metallopeptidase [Gemmatimonadaceae bacterium]MCW5824958.1 M23 family metallopeptidase [Gemmatimonadaceae bacterium]
MSPRTTRLLFGAAVAALAIAALRLPTPEFASPRALLAQLQEPDLQPWTEHDTLGRGETLSGLLSRRGLSTAEAAKVVRAATPLNPRRIPAGMPIELRGDTTDARPREISFRLGVDRIVRLARDGDDWAATEEILPWKVDTVLVRGTVREHLYGAIYEGSDGVITGRARDELAWVIADIYEYKIDMSRELQQGDQVRALFERHIAPDGTMKIGIVLAAGLQRAGTEIQAFRVVKDDGAVRYYDERGRSLAAAFLRAPLQFRRISSNFGNRRHPILGTMRQHQGMDYAANAGTPVRAIGDGTVIFAGVRGGYGNLLELRHPNGMVTRYAHLRGFASGIRRGSRVSIGETVAYVGSTGLSTAPHLHFEVLVGGVHRDPRRALANAEAGPALTGRDLARFEAARDAVVFALEQPAGIVRALGN